MNSSTLISKLRNYCNVLRDDGMSYGDYIKAAHLPAVPQDGGRALARTVQAGEPHPRAVRLAVDATIRNLHRLTRGEIWDAGKYKDKDGDIIERYPDGSERVRFRTAVGPNALFPPPSRTNQPTGRPVQVAKTH